MKLTLGFSPCPNDTFIFDALVNKKIDTGEITFDVVLEDVETLNRLALESRLDISKISFGTWPLVVEEYILLNSGSALGTGVGPLLIAKNNIPQADIDKCTVAIPGLNTTANMLFSLGFPNSKNKLYLKYNEIEDHVLRSASANVAGVIIHENRFTYAGKGLQKIIDLGTYWEEKTGSPIPLGGIVAKRSLDENIALKIDSLIRQSILYAFDKYPSLAPYVKANSMEMEESVMRKHIDLYVNDYSIALGENGKKAILKLLEVYAISNPSYQSTGKEYFL